MKHRKLDVAKGCTEADTADRFLEARNTSNLSSVVWLGRVSLSGRQRLVAKEAEQRSTVGAGHGLKERHSISRSRRRQPAQPPAQLLANAGDDDRIIVERALVSNRFVLDPIDQVDSTASIGPRPQCDPRTQRQQAHSGAQVGNFPVKYRGPEVDGVRDWVSLADEEQDLRGEALPTVL